MDKIRVSVIIPVYNVEYFLDDCIKSILNQQNFLKYEVIIIDDGSTDKSRDIIKKYTDQFDNIYSYYQKNSGQSIARNKGIKKAKGEFIYFFDSDDLIEENAIDFLYEMAIKESLELILFEGKSFYDKSLSNKEFPFLNYVRKNSYNKNLDGKELFVDMISNGDFFASPCLQFVKKEVLIKKNISFLEGYIHEDELFSYQLLLSCTKVKCIKIQLFHRRIREGSTVTSINFGKKSEAFIKVIEKTITYNEKLDINTLNLQHALNIRINNLLGQSIRYIVNLKVKERFYFHKKLNDQYKKLKMNNYQIKTKYKLYMIAPEIYRILQKIKQWN